MARMNFDDEGLLEEPCLPCDRAYIEDIWHEWCCDEKECLYMAESEGVGMKTNTHIVIKREDVSKYLTGNQIEQLDVMLNIIADGRKKNGKKPNNSYYICNTDEPYADKVLEVILKAESEG